MQTTPPATVQSQSSKQKFEEENICIVVPVALICRPNNKQTKRNPDCVKPKEYSTIDSTDVRNLPALCENKAGALVVEMIKSLPLW